IDALLGIAMLYLLFASTKRPAYETPQPTRAQSGDALIGIAAAIMLGSGCLKFSHVPAVVTEMTSLGLAGWKLNLVAALEIASGLLVLVPRLRSVGLPFASAYLGAAICAHVQSGQYFAVLPTMVVLGCCWLGAGLRYPHLLWSLAARGSEPANRN